jgi:hypothetical protein
VAKTTPYTIDLFCRVIGVDDGLALLSGSL